MINGIFLVLLFGGWLAAGLLLLAKRNPERQARRFAELPSYLVGGARFAALFDNAPMACALLDIDFRIMEWNRQAELLFGLKLEDVMGHNMIEIMVPSDENEKARDEMAAFFASGKIFLFTSPKLADTGKTVDMELQTAVLRDCEARPYGILAMATGITQSKATENELRIKEQYWRALLDNLSSMVWLKDTGSRFLAVNRHFARDITERRMTEDAIRGSRKMLAEAQRIAQVGSWELGLVSNTLSWSDEIFRIFEIDPEKFGASYEAFLNAIHPDDREAVSRAYTESLEKRVPYDIEHRLLMLDGRIKYVHERGATDYDADGKPVCSLGTVQDITERRLAEAVLHEREQEFRALAENSPDTIARYDRECRRTYANPTFARQTGVPSEALLGITPSQHFHNSPQAVTYEAKLREVLETGVESEYEFTWPARGKAIMNHIRIVPERDMEGRVVSVLAIGRDITALKETQRSLEASRARLRELAVLRNSEQEAERKQLAWEVHEGIGQYLMALRMNLSMLDGRLDQNSLAYGKLIRSMFEIVEKSVQLVREVTVELCPSVLDLGIVAALEWLGKKFMADTGIPCKLFLPDDDIPMDEHASTAIFRIAEEALANVAQHAKPEMVELTLDQRGGNYYLEVHDDGNGFDLTCLYDNSVIGLAWLREQIASLGGELNVFSVPGQGTVIEAIVPMHDILGER